MKRLMLAVLLLSGCPDEPTDGPRDTGIVNPPADSGVKMIVFEAEALSGTRLVFEGTLTDATLEVDVVAHEMTDVYGVAYRLEYDPAVLQYEMLERSSGFMHDDLFEVSNPRPGLVVVAQSAVGPIAGIALDGVAIAHARFTRLTPALTEIRIVRPFGLDGEGVDFHYVAGKGAIVER